MLQKIVDLEAKAMPIILRCIVALILAVCSVTHLRAQGTMDTSKPTELIILIHYFLCVKPPGVSCICTKEEEKKKSCPKCEEWSEAEKNFNRHVTLKPDAYSYKTGPPRANVFVSDVARELYGEGLPKNDAGHDITLGELYKNPEKYGWTEVPADRSKTGTLAVWPSVGGVVVSDKPQSPEGREGSIQVLYPSDKKAGQLNQTDARFLDPQTKPKYLTPPIASNFNQQLAPN